MALDSAGEPTSMISAISTFFSSIDATTWSLMAIAVFFTGHWVMSVLMQSFFLHRYAAHQMFTFRSPFWERFFHFVTILAQGPSYLNPHGYAVLHRMHHAYSDTEKDPHSPHHADNFFDMMLKTKNLYHKFAYREVEPAKEFTGPTPVWPAIDNLGQSWVFRILAGAAYVPFYVFFVPEGMWYLYLLLPAHWLMGPIHGAIVNWGGHKYGYVNFKKTKDESRNTLPFDFLTMGELFQNNHHGRATSPNFAYRWFEIDPTYQVMRLLSLLGIIRMERKKNAVAEVEDATQLPTEAVPELVGAASTPASA